MLKKISLILIIFLQLSLTACTEVIELSQKLVVQGIGIDKSDIGCKVTFQILNVKQSPDKDSGEQKEVQILKANGNTLVDAIENIRKQTGRDALLSQVLVLVIGDEMAKSGIRPFVDYFIRHHGLSPSIEVAVSKGEAEEILRAQKGEEPISSEEILSVLQMGLNDNRKLNFNLGKFISSIESYEDAKVHYIEDKKDGEDSCLMANKVAVFKKDKFIGPLNEEETRGFLLIKGKIKKIVDIVELSDGSKVTYVTSNIKSDVKVFEENQELKLLVSTKAKTYVSESEIDIELDDRFDEIKEKIETRMKNLIKTALEKTIYEYKADIIGISKRLSEIKGKMLKLDEETYDNIKCSVSTKVELNLIK